MKINLSVLLLLSSMCFFGQTKFKEGYYIDQNGKKITCLILKKKWKYSPKFITVKINEQQQEINCDLIKEFQVEKVKFREEVITYDTSDIEKTQLKFVTKTKQVRVLVDGAISLYLFEDDYDKFYLIGNQKDTIKQLLHKLKVNQSKNYYLSTYQRQLLRIEKDTTAYNEVKKLKYHYSELSDYVSEMNLKKGFDKPTVYMNKDSTAIQFRVGTSISNMKYYQDLKGNINKKVDFGKQIIYSVNSEIEFIPSMINKKYGFILEFIMDINEYKQEENYSNPSFINPDYILKYTNKNIFKLNFGIKRYFNINKNTSIFISPKVALRSFNSGNLYVQRDIDRDFEIYNPNFTISSGANYKNLVFECSYVINQNKDFSNSLLLGLKYNIFNYFKTTKSLY